jgi:hypothetical protein
MEYFNTL